jgi:hypothetical protein
MTTTAIQNLISAATTMQTVRDGVATAREQALTTGTATIPDERTAEAALDAAQTAAHADAQAMSDEDWAALLDQIADTVGMVAWRAVRSAR